jgi:pyridoxamine 5'-phosphate oxidase
MTDASPAVLEQMFAEADPFALFAAWLDEAAASEPNDPDAMALATVDADGLPDVRMVLLKGHGPDGFRFFTHERSAKGRELAGEPRAALCLHWKSLRRQVRVRGPVERLPPADADAYFASRAKRSRLGALASAQSQPLDARATLERRVAELEAEYADREPPRPATWGGYRVVPLAIEFWLDGPNRLHDRRRFTRPDAGAAWESGRLWP